MALSYILGRCATRNYFMWQLFYQDFILFKLQIYQCVTFQFFFKFFQLFYITHFSRNGPGQRLPTRASSISTMTAPASIPPAWCLSTPPPAAEQTSSWLPAAHHQPESWPSLCQRPISRY